MSYIKKTMKYILRLFTIALISLTIFSCQEEEPIGPTTLEGSYDGIFTVDYFDGGTFSNPVTITFNNGNYSSSSGENRRPAGGSGSYEITGNKIVFTDVNFWTAEFDWNLVLSGEYVLSQTRSSIIFGARKNEVGIYTYELDKK